MAPPTFLPRSLSLRAKVRIVTFTYDPFGRRLSKTVHREEIEDEDDDDGDDGNDDEREIPRTTFYVYDNEDIILELDHRGRIKGRYTHGLGIDEPLAVEKKRETFFYHADGLGSISALTDRRQRVVESYEYDSFGNLKRKGRKVKQPYTFTGREWDKEIGLYYYRARYYDAQAGRFISFDPIVHPATLSLPKNACNKSLTYPSFEALQGSPQKLNPFVYVENNPVNRIDPTGLISGRCIAMKAGVFLKCIGELIYGPSPPLLDPATALASCALCVYFANNLVYDPFTCGLCALNLAYHIPAALDCANKADNAKCEPCTQ